jgi:hypothetical protein
VSAWGWLGRLRRALEFATGYDGGIVDEEVAPAGRMRLRYNALDNRPEVSLSGASYVPLSVGDGGTNVETLLFTNSVAVNSGPDTDIGTLPAFTPAGDVVIVTYTCRFTFSVARTCVLKFYKNGAEVSSSDEYTVSTPGAFPAYSGTWHWVDESPAANDVYSIQAVADGNGAIQATTRRLTAVG